MKPKQTAPVDTSREARDIVYVRIADSARKHGVLDEDMLHALRCAARILERDDITLIIGPGRDGALLEIGVLNVDDDPAIVHAMPLRPKYFPYL